MKAVFMNPIIIGEINRYLSRQIDWPPTPFFFGCEPKQPQIFHVVIPKNPYPFKYNMILNCVN